MRRTGRYLRRHDQTLVRILSAAETLRPDSRRDQILSEAARLFGERGYDRTSMRDIAAAVGMLPGSMYYHFPSKEALLAAVYEAAIEAAIAVLHAATAGHANPWDRLEAASAAHLRTLVDGGPLAAVVVDGPTLPPDTRQALVRLRRRYESVFRDLVQQLDLAPDVKPRAFRLALLGSLNWALTWYRPGGDSPDQVAHDLFAVFRAGQPAPPPDRTAKP